MQPPITLLPAPVIRLHGVEHEEANNQHAVPEDANRCCESSRVAAAAAAPAAAATTPCSSLPDGSHGDSAYVSFLRLLRATWTDAPAVSVSYSNLRVEHRVPMHADASTKQQAASELPTLPRTLMAKLAALDPRSWHSSQHQTRAMASIASASGVHMPGSMTLVLAPPGAGKSTLLRALAGRLTGGNAPAEVTGKVTGELRWNGMTAEELAASGVHLNKLTALVDQADVHYPMLTVRETLALAADNSMPDIALLGNNDLVRQRQNLVQAVIDMMGLTECSETIVGSAAVRGVSGGQRRRVSVAEMLMGCPRMLLLDEITSGLDASTAYDIVRSLREWARIMNGAVTMVLLQPAPEIVDLFDQLVLMREGYVVFSGTQAQLRDHIKSLTGMEPPSSSQEPLAEWAVKWLAHPPVAGSSAQVVPLTSPPHSPQGVVPAVPVHLAPQLLSALPSDPAMVRFHMDEGNEYALDDPPTTEALRVVEGEKEAASGVVAVAAAMNLPNGAGDSLIAVPSARTGGVEMSSIEPVIASPAPVPAVASIPSSSKHLAQSRSSSSSRPLVVVPPASTAALLAGWQASAFHSSLQMEIAQLRSKAAGGFPPSAAASVSPFTRRLLYHSTSHGWLHHVRLLLYRELYAISRNHEVILYRLGQASVLGLVVGLLFLGLDDSATAAPLRVSLCFLLIMVICFSSLAEVPAMIEFTAVVVKQVDAGFYRPLHFVAGTVGGSMPLALIEGTIWGLLFYFLCNFYLSAGHFFFFLLTLLLTSLSLNSLVRCIAYLVPTVDQAISIVNPISTLFILFAGYLITKDNIPNWLIEFYWCNPFTWSLNSLVLNEFKSPRYTPEQSAAFLALFEVPNEWALKWGGIGFLLGVFVLHTLCGAWLIHRSRGTSGTRGARRVAADGRATEVGESEDDIAEQARLDIIADPEPSPASPDAGAALPFEKAALSFTDVCYSVEVDADDPGADSAAHGAKKTKKVQRQLLRGVTGYAAPGTITALMGSSGAGKTTLLDCLAGRKTQGTLTGSILVNGVAPTLASRGMLGYVQQQDEHFSLTTVREAVDFSAQLRLPPSVTQVQRDGFVDSILRDLELIPLADRLVGDVVGGTPGLAPGERKRLTIAVELAANPPILFLDEPTTGLDARAALVVLRVLHKIAARGRSVVCTIHQPSRELFLMFDRLLLLQPGGRCVYFGDVGRRGQSVVDHFTGLPLQPPIEPPADEGEENVAVWMLTAMRAEATRVGDRNNTAAAAAGGAPFAQLYAESDLCKRNVEQQSALAREFTRPPSAAVTASSSSSSTVYARSSCDQFVLLFSRLSTVYWRSGPLQCSKLVSCFVVGLVLGVVYFDIDDNDEAGMQSSVAALFSTLANATLMIAACAVPPMFSMREAFYRETASNTYKEWIHAVCCILVEVPYTVLAVLLLLAPFYPMMSLRVGAAWFFHCLLVVCLLTTVYVSMNQVLSTVSPDPVIAVMLADFFTILLYIFGGLFLPRPSIPIGGQWVYHLNPLPKAFVAVVLPQWACDEQGEGRGCALIDTLEHGVESKKQWAQRFVGSGDGWEYYYIGWLALSMIVVQIAFVIAVKKVSFRSR